MDPRFEAKLGRRCATQSAPIRRFSIEGLIPPSESRASLPRNVANGFNSPQFMARAIAALYASGVCTPLSGEEGSEGNGLSILGYSISIFAQPEFYRHTLAEAPRMAGNSKAVSCRSAFNLAAYLRERYDIREPILTIICGAGFRKAASRLSIPVPRLAARLPIFFSIVFRFRTSFWLASAKTFLISALCL